MAFIVVEFEEKINGTNSVGVVNAAWLTPRKCECWWPPYKTQHLFDKAVKSNESPCETSWILCFLLRLLYQTDDYSKAKAKSITAIQTSDLQSEAEEPRTLGKRKSIKKRLFAEIDEESSDNQAETEKRPSLERPPRFQQNFLNGNDDFGAASTSTHTLGTLTGFNDEQTSINKKLLTAVLLIKEQNNQILQLLQQTVSSNKGALPENFPIDVKLPMSTSNEITKVEEYLQISSNITSFVSYLSTIGGREIAQKTTAILRAVLANSLAKEYSYLGTRNAKKSFVQLALKAAIVRSVLTVCSQGLEEDVTKVIKDWLKHAPQRAAKDKGDPH